MSLGYRLKLIGSAGSPYTRKMLAVLRYRHIDYDLLWGDPSLRDDLPKTKPALLPTFYFHNPNGELIPTTDSTPIIKRLEQDQAGRLIIPANPVLKMINAILEDFGDEWCTKYMFHYRWAYQADIDNAGSMIPMWIDRTLPTEVFQTFKKSFSERQVGRIGVVGSNELTAPVIEQSYQRLLGLLDAHFHSSGFLLGERPCSADFAIYGQFTQLTRVDPTPAALAAKLSPRTVAWVDCCEDLSGLEPKASDWFDTVDLPASLKAILAEVGRVYVPAMLANEAAVIAEQKHWESTIDGQPWTQKTFPYQAKCLRWLREEYAELSASDRATMDSILADTGCNALFA
jgi:glutathione S-transferase